MVSEIINGKTASLKPLLPSYEEAISRAYLRSNFSDNLAYITGAAFILVYPFPSPVQNFLTIVFRLAGRTLV